MTDKLTVMNGQTMRHLFQVNKSDVDDMLLDFEKWRAHFGIEITMDIIWHETSFDTSLHAVKNRDVAIGHFILGLVLYPYATKYLKTKYSGSEDTADKA